MHAHTRTQGCMHAHTRTQGCLPHVGMHACTHARGGACTRTHARGEVGMHAHTRLRDACTHTRTRGCLAQAGACTRIYAYWSRAGEPRRGGYGPWAVSGYADQSEGFPKQSVHAHRTVLAYCTSLKRCTLTARRAGELERVAVGCNTARCIATRRTVLQRGAEGLAGAAPSNVPARRCLLVNAQTAAVAGRNGARLQRWRRRSAVR